MSEAEPSIIEHSVEKAHIWLNEVAKERRAEPSPPHERGRSSSGSGRRAARRAFSRAEPQMLDMPDRLVDQLSDMGVIQRVNDVAPPLLPNHQADIPQ
jgi:hypothetical protein